MRNSFTPIFMGAAGGGSSPFWMVVYGDSSANYAGGVVLDGSDNIVVFGYQLLKFAIDGSLTFQKTFYNSGEGSCVALDSSGNIYTGSGASGFNGSLDAITVKHNSSGVQQWAKARGGSGYDVNNAIVSDANGNNYSVGLQRNGNVNKPGIIKYNSSGTNQFSKSIGTSGSTPHGSAYCASINSVGNICWGGFVGPISGAYPGGIHQINSSGSLQYSVKITDGTDMSIRGMASDGSGNTTAVGWVEGISPASGVKQGVIIKYANTGGPSISWGRKVSVNFSGTYKPVIFYGCALDSSNNLYVVGTSADASDVVSGNIVKYNSSGTLQWQRRIKSGTTNLYAVNVTSDDNIVVTGQTNGVGSGNYDVIVLHLNSDGSGAGTYATDLVYESSSLASASNSYTFANYGYELTDNSGNNGETNISSNVTSDASFTSNLYSVD